MLLQFLQLNYIQPQLNVDNIIRMQSSPAYVSIDSKSPKLANYDIIAKYT